MNRNTRTRSSRRSGQEPLRFAGPSPVLPGEESGAAVQVRQRGFEMASRGGRLTPIDQNLRDQNIGLRVCPALQVLFESRKGRVGFIQQDEHAAMRQRDVSELV